MEAQSNTITLPEDDPAVLGQIFHYYFGKLEYATTDYVKSGPPGRQRILKLYREVYITADKFCMEELSNLLIDWLVKQSETSVLTIAGVEEMFVRGLEDSPLVLFSTKALAWALYSKGWESLSKK